MANTPLNVYTIYGEIENTLGRHYLTHSIGNNEGEAIRYAKEILPEPRDSFFDRKLNAVKVEVEGFRILAEPLEQKVASK